jgi:galactokinase
MSPGALPNTAFQAGALERVISLFRRSYGTGPAVVASAPGRVNLIGEHLDYNGGPVLPFAIDRRTWVAAGPGDGFELVSAEPGFPAVRREGGSPQGDWSDYVVGVARALGEAGARIAVASDLAVGAGLSSSAALAVAAAAALARLSGRSPGPASLADTAFRAEHDFVGVRCGRMDQTIVAGAADGTALFLETATGAAVTCPFPYTVWIMPTGVEHVLAAGGYNARRAECERALALCRERWPDLASLAALDPDSLPEALARLPAPLDRRVRHVVTETARTRRARAALERGALAELGALLTAGHASLRDDFESSVSEADFLVHAGLEHGALGGRLTGAGWGGSVILLLPDGNEAEVAGEVAEAFARRFGRTIAPWPARAAGGARLDLVA